MKRTALTRLVFLLAILGGRLGIAQADGPKAELVVDVDVNDKVWLRQQNMTEQDVTELVAKFRTDAKRCLSAAAAWAFSPTARSYPIRWASTPNMPGQTRFPPLFRIWRRRLPSLRFGTSVTPK